jgi:hypothetical protein
MSVLQKLLFMPAAHPMPTGRAIMTTVKRASMATLQRAAAMPALRASSMMMTPP